MLFGDSCQGIHEACADDDFAIHLWNKRLLKLRLPTHHTSFEKHLLLETCEEVAVVKNQLTTNAAKHKSSSFSDYAKTRWVQEHNNCCNNLKSKYGEDALVKHGILPAQKLYPVFLEHVRESSLGWLPLLGFRKYAKWQLIKAYFQIVFGRDISKESMCHPT